MYEMISGKIFSLDFADFYVKCNYVAQPYSTVSVISFSGLHAVLFGDPLDSVFSKCAAKSGTLRTSLVFGSCDETLLLCYLAHTTRVGIFRALRLREDRLEHLWMIQTRLSTLSGGYPQQISMRSCQFRYPPLSRQRGSRQTRKEWPDLAYLSLANRYTSEVSRNYFPLGRQ
jgi:hypothetical protein